MSTKVSHRKKFFGRVSAVVALTLVFFAIYITGGIINSISSSDQGKSMEQTGLFQPPLAMAETGNLKIHFLDVGQADCILIQEPSGKTMLIDAGNNEDSELVTKYIQNLGITKIDVLIGTHPHEDHIGGLDAVINDFDIGTIIMPNAITTTQTYQDVLTAIKNKGYTITSPVSGKTDKLGSATYTILSPNSSTYSDLNNYSVCLRLVYANTSFLFMGDADTLVENEILAKGYPVSASLLKVAHHGSDTSTSLNFLNKVNPKFAVISVGTGNSYGHPAAATLDKLFSKGVAVYRTDQAGTIIATYNGTDITFNKSSSIAILKPPASFTVISGGYNSIKTSWAAVSGATGYQIFRATSSTGKYSLVGTTKSLSYTNVGLTMGKTYYYKVRGYRTVGTTNYYSEYAKVSSVKTGLAKPTAVKLSNIISSSIKVSWASVSGASGYRIFRATSSKGTYKYVKATTGKYWTNSGLSSSKYYYYKVMAYKTIGKSKIYGATSAIVIGKTIKTKSVMVYCTKTGKKYHLSGCRFLSKSKIPISLSAAKAAKFTPCSVCNPPK